MGKVLPFTGATKLDIPMEGVAEGMKASCARALVIGEDHDGHPYYAASFGGRKADVLWMLEMFKAKLLAGDFD